MEARFVDADGATPDAPDMAGSGSTKTPLALVSKRPLCYLCALRFSTMFQQRPPPLLADLRRRQAKGPGVSSPGNEEIATTDAPGDGANGPPLPLMDASYHPHFYLVCETRESSRRFQSVQLGADTLTGRGDEATVSGGTSTPSAMARFLPHLCCACFGLYQFIDYVHAPTVAAVIRCSPFTDSEAVSVNINVHRSSTFLWLAAAALFYDVSGTGDRPRAASVIPEEHNSFKDFYMSDLRARVLQYLLSPHAALSLNLLGYERYKVEIERRRVSGSDASLGVKQAGLLVAKRIKVESVVEPTACMVAENETPATLGASCVEGGKVEALQCPLPQCVQGFRYSPSNDGVIADVECVHGPSEVFVSQGIVPSQYCNNKSGCVLNYAMLFDYVFPYLVQEEARYRAQVSKDIPTRGTWIWADHVREVAQLRCTVVHKNLFFIGSYRKLSRTMPQSPWFTEGARIGSVSLQEVIADPFLSMFFPTGLPPATLPSSLPSAVVERVAAGWKRVGTSEDGGAPSRKCLGRLTGCQASPWQEIDPFQQAMENVRGYGSYKFHSAGREDVDVRMLGTGRPFVVELISPHREKFSEQDLCDLERAVNSSEGGAVEVCNLRPTTGDITVKLARHSESKTKHYRCVVWCSRAIANPATDRQLREVEATKDLTIMQRTPMRVLHRRSLLARPRTIHSIRVRLINAHWLLVDIETQAGTYVKEFVHGDMGRTTPSLGMLLGGRTDIIQLDVLGMTTDGLEAAGAESEGS